MCWLRFVTRSCSDTSHVQVSEWCIVFAGIGAGAIGMGMLQQYGFGCMGQRLTRRLRVLLFTSMFRQVCLPAVLDIHDDTVASLFRIFGRIYDRPMQRSWVWRGEVSLATGSPRHLVGTIPDPIRNGVENLLEC